MTSYSLGVTVVMFDLIACNYDIMRAEAVKSLDCFFNVQSQST